MVGCKYNGLARLNPAHYLLCHPARVCDLLGSYRKARSRPEPSPRIRFRRPGRRIRPRIRRQRHGSSLPSQHTRLQSVLRQAFSQDNRIQSLDHRSAPGTGYAVTNLGAVWPVATNQTARTSGLRPSGAVIGPSRIYFFPKVYPRQRQSAPNVPGRAARRATLAMLPR